MQPFGHKTFIGNFYDPLGFFAKGKKSSSSGYQVPAYSGPTPPAVDSPGQEILRPTQKQVFDILMRRSQGKDVGYDPERKDAAISLLKSQIRRQEEDDVRDAKGMASRSGLGGNLAAQQALEGRVRRDASRNLSEGVDSITIEDLARANQERDVNTARLQQFNDSNFGQENTRADFGLRQYATEQGLQLQGQDFNSRQALANRELNNQTTSDLIKTGIGVASLASGNPTYAIMTAPSAMNLVDSGGKGIAPASTTYSNPNQPSDTLSALMRGKRSRYLSSNTNNYYTV